MKRTVLTSSLSLLMAGLPAAFTLLSPNAAFAADDGEIRGRVTNSTDRQPLAGALVIVQCSCLSSSLEVTTNARGIYRFSNLPPGNYTIQVLSGEADVSKVTQLPRSAQFRADFSLNPSVRFVEEVVVESTAVRQDTASATKLDMEAVKNLPVGSSTSRDFTAAVDIAATAGRDSAGITLAGTTGAETKYTVNGANVSNPAFGTVGASIIQEFVSTIEIQEAGYDAEFGGASGGQVSARRVSGTNTFRGEAGVRVAPRFANPRFITGTDEALRVTAVPDLNAQAYAVVRGPIIKDKLFFSVGVAPAGTQTTLRQQFFKRKDVDNNGAYEDCPYENGAKDCAEGADYIDSEKFAEQKFRTANVGVQYLAGLDYNINPKHTVGVTYIGALGYDRTTYRLPFSSDPLAFGTNPLTSPLGGASRVATGVVNDHFGWDRGQQHTVSLEYAGRAAQDTLEIDANVSYTEFKSERAWKVDNQENYSLTATQEVVSGLSDPRNLFEFLDRNGATNLVEGVDEACNDAGLPGVACPIRNWLSGGLGEYGTNAARRVQGDFALTHFFEAAGSHQLKYGGLMSYETNSIYSKYSGSNSADFYDNCGPGQTGGGEWCYDPASDSYDVNYSSAATRVNNNRFMLVNPNTPDSMVSFGYGRVRSEQDDLRALASSSGDGVRVEAYDETTSTYNYALFLQDKWAILSNLSVNFGARWEVQDMRDILGRNQITILDNVAPRVGILYDWTDEGRSRLFASYGWFFQPLPLQLNSRVFGGLINVRRNFTRSSCQGKTTTAGGSVNSRWTDVGDQPTEYCVDNTSGNSAFTTGLTEGNVVPNLKGNYNQQFQIGYEQEVIEDLVLSVRWLHTDLGRAVEDVSVNGGQDFIVANPGDGVKQSDINAQQATCDGLRSEFDDLTLEDDNFYSVSRELQRCEYLVDAYKEINTLFDRPTRNYDAWTLQLKKRFAKNWLLIASYTYSRLVGNYDGFVDVNTGAINIGASTQYDIPELVRNSYGPLSANRPHVAKLDGFYSFDLKKAGRMTVGTSFRYQSGVPVNVRGSNFRYNNAVFVVPRGSGGRINGSYQWNLNFGYAYPLKNDLELELTARVINLTNSKATLRVDDIYSFQATRPIAGGDLNDLKHARPQDGANPNDFYSRSILIRQGNYGVATSFQQPMSGQFEVKFRF